MTHLDLFRLLRLRETLANVPAFAVDRATRQALVDGMRDLDAEIALEHRAWRLARERLATREAEADPFATDILLLFSGSAVTELES